tara:strand:- start:13 stop:123 length:111 start_codon:yes stop_codon:yes gene_type:complete
MLSAIDFRIPDMGTDRDVSGNPGGNFEVVSEGDEEV